MQKFNIGDKVKVVSLQNSLDRGQCYIQTGQTGTVVDFTDDPYDTIPYLVDFGDADSWWFGESNLELQLDSRESVILEIEKLNERISELHQLLETCD